MKNTVRGLQSKKNDGLSRCIETYWASYGAFSAAQSNIINPKGGEAAALAQQRRQLQEERKSMEAQHKSVAAQLAKQQQALLDGQKALLQQQQQHMARHGQPRQPGQAQQNQRVMAAAVGAYQGGGQNAQRNQQLVGAVVGNQQVQRAAVNVARDKNVQQAAWKYGKQHAQGQMQGQGQGQARRRATSGRSCGRATLQQV